MSHLEEFLLHFILIKSRAAKRVFVNTLLKPKLTNKTLYGLMDFPHSDHIKAASSYQLHYLIQVNIYSKF